MEICSIQHEEIVFERGTCPLCSANEKIEKLERENEDYEKEIVELKDEIKELEGEAK